jgi:hypothetical protein
MRPLAFLMERMPYCDEWGHHGRSNSPAQTLSEYGLRPSGTSKPRSPIERASAIAWQEQPYEPYVRGVEQSYRSPKTMAGGDLLFLSHGVSRRPRPQTCLARTAGRVVQPRQPSRFTSRARGEEHVSLALSPWDLFGLFDVVRARILPAGWPRRPAPCSYAADRYCSADVHSVLRHATALRISALR